MAQNEYNNWIFGEGAGITFINGKALPIPGNNISAFEGCATYSDPVSGKLLFYTDGMTIWNSFHEVIVNGSGLRGGRSSTQAALILPNPAKDKQFYVLSAPDRTGIITYELYYTLVDFQDLNGAVIQKNILINSGLNEKLTAVPHCNGIDYWILAGGYSGLHAFLLDSNGISKQPIISIVPGISSISGYLKASPDGTKLATGSFSFQSVSSLYLYEFNSQNGKIMNTMRIDTVLREFTYTTTGVGYYGVEFSVSGEMLYAIRKTESSSALLQFNVSNMQINSILSSKAAIGTDLNVFAMMRGPDSMIYIARSGEFYLDRISRPDLPSYLCGYQSRAFILYGICRWGLPNFPEYQKRVVFPDVYVCAGDTISLGEGDNRPGRKYLWFPSAGLDNPQIACPVARQIDSITIYTRTETLDNGCTRSMQQKVILNNRIKASIESTNNTVLCPGDSTQLRILGARSARWVPSAGLSNPNILNPIAKPDTTTLYTVYIERGSCRDSLSYLLEVAPKVNADAGPDQYSCSGAVIMIGPRKGITKGYSYQWTPLYEISNPLIANPFVRPLRKTEYILTVISPNGCIDYDTVIITPGNAPKVICAGDTAVCAGTPITLTASGANTYTWFRNDQALSYIDSVITITEFESCKYKVIGSLGGCSDAASASVTVYPLPLVSSGKDTIIICQGDSIVLGGKPQPGIRYSWHPGIWLQDSASSQALCVPDGSFPASGMQYIVTAMNRQGCSSQDTFYVMLRQNVQVDIQGNDTIVVCPGESIQLAAMGGLEYTWWPDKDLDNPRIEKPLCTPTTSRMYYAKGNIGNCTGIDSVYIRVQQKPKLLHSAMYTVCSAEPIQMSVQGADSYLWQPGILFSDSLSANPVFLGTDTSLFITVQGFINGCNITDTILITIQQKSPITITSTDSILCAPQQILIRASGAEYYEWSFSNNTTILRADSLLFVPDSSCTVYCKGFTNQCYSVDSIKVRLLPLITVNACCDTSICFTDAQAFTLSATHNADSLYWIGPNGPLQGKMPRIEIPGRYIAIAQSESCGAQDTVYIQERNPRQFRILSSAKGKFRPGQIAKIMIEIPDIGDTLRCRFSTDSTALTLHTPLEIDSLHLINSSAGILEFNYVAQKANTITLPVSVYLPSDITLSDTVHFSVNLQSGACTNVQIDSLIQIEYDPTCAWQLRGIKANKYGFFTSIQAKHIQFTAGLQGTAIIQIYTVTGNQLLQIQQWMEPGQHLFLNTQELSPGMYLCLIRFGNQIFTTPFLNL